MGGVLLCIFPIQPIQWQIPSAVFINYTGWFSYRDSPFGRHRLRLSPMPASTESPTYHHQPTGFWKHCWHPKEDPSIYKPSKQWGYPVKMETTISLLQITIYFPYSLSTINPYGFEHCSHLPFGTPKSSIFIGCSILNHPAVGVYTPISGNPHIKIYHPYPSISTHTIHINIHPTIHLHPTIHQFWVPHIFP